jgi:hypothetical protein
MQVYRSLLAEHLEVRAPNLPRYVLRSFGTLARRLGAAQRQKRSRSDAPRSYSIQWRDELRSILLRKATSSKYRAEDDKVTDFKPSEPDSLRTCGTTNFSKVESVEQALDRRGFLLLHPSEVPLKKQTSRRLENYPSLKQLLADSGQGQEPVRILATDWHREASGRIHVRNPALQNMPSEARIRFSACPGFVLLDVDMRAAHMRIAAVLTGDQKLLKDILSKDIYEKAAAELGVSRETAKEKLLMALNGGEGRASTWLLHHYPKLASFQTEIKAAWSQHRTIAFQSLAGRNISIPTGHLDEFGWRTALATRWLAGEADLTDWVLARLHGQIGALEGRLILPMFDGLLLEAPRQYSEAVGWAVVELYREAGKALKVPVEAKVAIGTRWKM